MWSLKIGIFPGRKKVSQGKPTEKRVVFIRAGKPCRPSSIRGPPADRGSPHDSAWIMLHCNRNSLNLSKASQFGSTLVGGRPLRVCVSGVRCALGFVACWLLARVSLFGFLGGMLSFFPPECAKYSRSGHLGGVLSVHIALSKLSPICKSPGRALQASGERGLTPLKPAPNRNILRIRAHFPTR